MAKPSVYEMILQHVGQLEYLMVRHFRYDTVAEREAYTAVTRMLNDLDDIARRRVDDNTYAHYVQQRTEMRDAFSRAGRENRG